MFAALWLLAAPHAQATAPADETVELIRLVDLSPNQAVRDAQRLLLQAQSNGDTRQELRAWRILEAERPQPLRNGAARAPGRCHDHIPDA